MVASLDAVGTEMQLQPDRWWFLVEQFTDVAGLTTSAVLDYRVCQPSRITDPNLNDVFMDYTPFGLPARSWTVSRGRHGGRDTRRA